MPQPTTNCNNRFLTARAMKFSCGVFVISLAAWLATLGGWGYCLALQSPETNFVASITERGFGFQIADIPSSDRDPLSPGRWWIYPREWDSADFNSNMELPLVAQLGLIRYMQTVPCHGRPINVGRPEVTYEPSWSFAECRSIIIPAWLIAIVATVLPIRWYFIRYRQSVYDKRVAQGLCPICKYDLRVVTDRCPECGEWRTNGGQIVV